METEIKEYLDKEGLRRVLSDLKQKLDNSTSNSIGYITIHDETTGEDTRVLKNPNNIPTNEAVVDYIERTTYNKSESDNKFDLYYPVFDFRANVPDSEYGASFGSGIAISWNETIHLVGVGQIKSPIVWLTSANMGARDIKAGDKLKIYNVVGTDDVSYFRLDVLENTSLSAIKRWEIPNSNETPLNIEYTFEKDYQSFTLYGFTTGKIYLQRILLMKQFGSKYNEDFTTTDRVDAMLRNCIKVWQSPDWSLTNSSEPSYIKNKPTKLSQFNNDLDVYYTKSVVDDKINLKANSSEVYNKTAVDNKILEAKNYADTKISEVIGDAPEALDTLKEIADALNNDGNLAVTLTNQITEEKTRAKAAETALSTAYSELAAVAKSGNYNDLENTPTDVSHFNNDANYITKEELDNTEEVVAAALNDLNTNKADKTEVFPVKATYEEMVEMRDQGKLIPGQYYQITDYVTTINEPLNPNARSAGHPFDILVRADSTTVLNEQAWAVRHDGDTYFQNARLEAWELKYRLDNVQWSKQTGTYVTDEENGYTFLLIGDITLSGHTYKLLQGFGMYIEDRSDYALMETVAEGEQIICYYGDPEDFDPEEPEVVGTASGVEEVTEPGKGTITWMKDEWGNECPYDFKNVQFKRYMTTDSVSGRDGLGGKYMVADPNNRPKGLSVEDTEDFIWAYTFSSDNAGGEQTDYSLTAEHQVHDNVMKPYSGGLNNNVMFGSYIYGNEFEIDCYDNSIGSYMYYNSIGSDFHDNSIGSNFRNNSIGSDFHDNSIGSNFRNNSIGSGFQYNNIGSDIYSNSIGSNMYNNSIGSNFQRNSIGSNFQQNSIGSNFRNNSIGSGFQYNNIGSDFHDNSIGSNFRNNSIGSNFQLNTIDDGVQYTAIGVNIKYVHVLNGVAGKSSSKLKLNFAVNKTYTQVATMNSAGELKIYVPGDNNYLLWTGTQAEYDAIPTKSDTTIYIIKES